MNVIRNLASNVGLSSGSLMMLAGFIVCMLISKISFVPS